MYDQNQGSATADISLRDDLLTGAQQFAEHTGFPIRRVRHLIEQADRAHESGDLTHAPMPFVRRGALLISRRSWLDRWLSGERVDVPRGDPPVDRGPGKKAKKGRAETEPAPVRISSRTGNPVRPYRRRTPGAGEGA